MLDQGHHETELILQRTEAEITRVYRQAAEEIQKKLDGYLRRFQIKDNIKRELLKSGEITKEEYNYWRTGQIMISKRWEEMRDSLAEDLHNSNDLARSVAFGHMPEVYATNHNYATFQVEKGSMVDTSYTLYDRDTVERIIRDQPDLLPPPGPKMSRAIAANKDIAWQKGQIQSVMLQGILQGESIPNLSKRISNSVSVANRNASIRYARTATTGAENAGRVAAYERASGMGIELEQEWLATLDGRTRHEHRQLDGQHVPVGKPFTVDGYEIEYPGDPSAPGYLIWNCRCTLVPRVKGVDQSNAPRNSKLGSMSYDEWKHEHETQYQAVVPTLQTMIGKAVSVADVNNIINSQGWFRTTGGVTSKADLTGCDLESAKSIASSYQQVFEKYPKLAGRFDAPDAHPRGMNNNTYAWCYIQNGGKVQVNPNRYNSWQSLVRSYERDVNINWHPKGTTAESIVTHEIGHAIDGLLAREKVLGGITSSGEYRYASSSLKTTIMKRAAKIDTDVEGAMAFSNKWGVEANVSRYASKNAQEWFAECFAEYITSANPRTVARLFGEELERLVEKLS